MVWNKGLTKETDGRIKDAWNKGTKGVVKGYWTGKKRSPETIKKMSESMKGKPAWSKGTKGIVKAWNKGLTKKTDERVNNISKKLKGRFISPHSAFKNGHPCYLKNHSDKVKMAQSERMKGNNPSLETRKKMSLAKIGIIPWNKGISHLAREKHPAWKGGITPIYNLIRSSMEYKKWYKEVFVRDNYTCQECFIRGGVKLTAHHIYAFSKILSDFLKEYSQFSPVEDKEILCRLSQTYKPFWEISNGITYCHDCHKEIHRRIKCQG